MHINYVSVCRLSELCVGGMICRGMYSMLKDSFRLPCCQYLRQIKLCDPFERGHGKGCVLVFERVAAMYAITDIPVPVWNHY